MTKRGGVKQVNNSETSLKINSGFKSIKFGLVSLLTIATLIGTTSVNASPRRNRRQGKTTLNQNNTRINAGMTSGYSNKFFTNTLITFMEQRQIDVDTVINAGTTTGIALLKADVVGNKPAYKLCFPCSSIVMKGNVEEATSMTGEKCYTLKAGDFKSQIVIPANAQKTCGDLSSKRLTIRSNDEFETIADSANLAIVQNDFGVDYDNIALSEDTETKELSQVFLDAKAKAVEACVNSDFSKSYDTVKGLFIGSTVASGVATGTGAAGTAISALNINKGQSATVDYDKLKKLVDVDVSVKDYFKCETKKALNTIVDTDETCDITSGTTDSSVKTVFAKALAMKDLNNELFSEKFMSFVDKYKTETDESKKTEYANELKSRKSSLIKDFENVDDLVANVVSAQKSLETKLSFVEENLIDKIESDKNLKKKYAMTGANIANVALSGATSVSGVATSVMGFSAVGEIDKLINRVKECKSAASKMYDAGLALEAQLQELKGE